jgi:PKD repeat protein
MRSSRVITLVSCAALLAACSDSSGPPNGNNAAPSANFTFDCSDLTCTFTDRSADTDGSIASQAWTFGDGQTGTGATATHTYAAANTYNVTVKATDNEGASATSAAQAVTVTAPTAGEPSASFTVACSSVTCTLTNTTTLPANVATWAWTFGDGQTSAVQSPGTVTYNVSTVTTFTITLVTTSITGATSQATHQVTVTPAATLTCNGVDCTLPVPAGATVLVTLVSSDCQAHGDKFVITQPTPADTLFTDGCFATPGTTFPLNNGAAYTTDTQLAAEVISGVAGTTTPQLRVTGDFTNGWTLEFDDGFVGPGEPDFNDLVIQVKATGP